MKALRDARRAQPVVGRVDDVLKIAKQVAPVLRDVAAAPDAVAVVSMINKAITPFKSIVDAAQYKRARDVTIAVAVNQLWAEHAGDVKKRAFAMALKTVIGSIQPHARALKHFVMGLSRAI